MKNKKGFTLVELVIVIAVIAILAGVMIGTFAGVISRANQSKALQKAKAEFDEVWVEFVADEHEVPGWIVVANDGSYTLKKASKYTISTENPVAVEVKKDSIVKIADATTDYAVAVRFSENGYEVVLVKISETTFTDASGVLVP